MVDRGRPRRLAVGCSRGIRARCHAKPSAAERRGSIGLTLRRFSGGGEHVVADEPGRSDHAGGVVEFREHDRQVPGRERRRSLVRRAACPPCRAPGRGRRWGPRARRRARPRGRGSPALRWSPRRQSTWRRCRCRRNATGPRAGRSRPPAAQPEAVLRALAAAGYRKVEFAGLPGGTDPAARSPPRAITRTYSPSSLEHTALPTYVVDHKR
jgi:hypothetical protein